MRSIEGLERIGVARLCQGNRVIHCGSPGGGRRGQWKSGGEHKAGHDNRMPLGRQRLSQAGMSAFRSRNMVQKKIAAAKPISDTTRQSAP